MIPLPFCKIRLFALICLASKPEALCLRRDRTNNIDSPTKRIKPQYSQILNFYKDCNELFPFPDVCDKLKDN
ncbi:MAG: hypothetical protein HC903_00555 [Methylacidiphilales bacterium]|nr:hypothetical protein [Candidatus Methylacidiphilales bacterium]NJR14896.1 hypothetical protein [Calothrix sp. CSU_2_0]